MSQLSINTESVYPEYKVIQVLKSTPKKKTVKVMRDGNYYILKIYNVDSVPKHKLQSIVQLLTKLSERRNPHFIQMYEASYDHDLTYMGVVTEFLDVQKLNINEQQIWQIISDVLLYTKQQITSSLTMFHPKRVHANLIASKLFNTKTGTILCEFNVNYYLTNHTTGQLSMVAPECIKNGVYNITSDIWMLGFYLYQLIYGPQSCPNIDTLHKKIIKGLQIPFHPAYSLNLNNLVKLLLSYQPDLRLDIQQIKAIVDMNQSSSTLNLRRIMPQFKIDQLSLHKNKQQTRSQTEIHNVVYLPRDHYQQPYFPPSRIKKQVNRSPSGSVFFFEQLPSQHIKKLTLPKVTLLRKLKVQQMKSTLKDITDTQRLQNYTFTKYNTNYLEYKSDSLWTKEAQNSKFEKKIKIIASHRSPAL